MPQLRYCLCLDHQGSGHWGLLPQAIAWLRHCHAMQERVTKKKALSCYYLTKPFNVSKWNVHRDWYNYGRNWHAVQTLVLLQRLANVSSYSWNHGLPRQHRSVPSAKNQPGLRELTILDFMLIDQSESSITMCCHDRFWVWWDELWLASFSFAIPNTCGMKVLWGWLITNDCIKNVGHFQPTNAHDPFQWRMVLEKAHILTWYLYGSDCVKCLESTDMHCSMQKSPWSSV